MGNPGDTGVLEVSDLMFTVQGSTEGAILVEWNVRESSQGSGNASTIAISLISSDVYSWNVGLQLPRYAKHL